MNETENKNHKQALAAVLSFAIIGGSWQFYGANAETQTNSPLPFKSQVASMATSLFPLQIDTDYVVATLPAEIRLEPGEIKTAVVTIQNTSQTTWDGNLLRLGTVFHTGDKDRMSDWQTEAWLSPTRIAPVGLVNQTIAWRQLVSFNVELKAPNRTGAYREYFQPVLDGVSWLNGATIALNLQVGETGIPAASNAPKQVIIDRPHQRGLWLEDGVVVASLPISTGKSGYTTPAGEYRVMNHIENAYSQEYELWMPNWMGLISNQNGYRGYGIHGLPYWRVNPARYEEGKIYPGGRLYTQGRLYEGYSHLGTPMSHGCIRFGVRESGILFNWIEDGTSVTVI